MLVPSERIYKEMASNPASLWFVPVDGGEGIAVVIKAFTGAIKAVIGGCAIDLTFGIVEEIGQRYLCVATKIHSDPEYPLVFCGAQRHEEEHRALEELLRRGSAPFFLFDELRRCVARGSCELEATERNAIRELLGEVKTLYVGGFGEACRRALDCLEVTISPSTLLEGAVPISTVTASANVRDLVGMKIYAVGREGRYGHEIVSLAEGAGQEFAVWQTLEGLFPLGIAKSPLVEEGGKERELTDIFCHYELGLFLVESKALSVYSAKPGKTTERKMATTHKHTKKALSQFRGALSRIRGGQTIKTDRGRPIEFDRELVPHCIILVTELLPVEGWEGIVQECLEFACEHEAMIHILDIRELVALVGLSRSKEAFDYNLMERFRVFAETGNPMIRSRPEPDAAGESRPPVEDETGE